MWARTALLVVHAPSAGERASVAEFCPGSPAPMQFNVKVCAPVPCSITVVEPEIACAPDHAPLPVHDVALLLVQLRVALWPGMTALGLIEILTVAFGGGCGVRVDFAPPLQPERTKAETRRMTKIRDRGFLVSASRCITPPFRTLWESKMD